MAECDMKSRLGKALSNTIIYIYPGRQNQNRLRVFHICLQLSSQKCICTVDHGSEQGTDRQGNPVPNPCPAGLTGGDPHAGPGIASRCIIVSLPGMLKCK